MQKDLTRGNVLTVLIQFSAPYLLSCFLQTFYGLADLFVIGLFNGAASTTAVSVGSQVMHMITVVVIGLAMGSTVAVSHLVGAKKNRQAARTIGNTVTLFLLLAVAGTGLLMLSVNQIIALLLTPEEAVIQTQQYLMVCFVGIPFITAYNVISCIFRGLGDAKTPMYFVALAGVGNIVLDVLLVGVFDMAAMGAALATVLSQAASVFAVLLVMRRRPLAVSVTKRDFLPQKGTLRRILSVGVPTAAQDGFIQIAFLVITAIANQRGVVPAASVGIVEKIISFLFLVPSAMLSSISAIAAQNAGAGCHQRSRQTLRYGLTIAVTFGGVVAVATQFIAPVEIGLFTGDNEVIRMGSQYLRAYVWDCAIAGIHFCFSGYFCAYEHAHLSFLHNLLSITLVRIPGAYLASIYFPDTLFPMGAVVPLGSALSAIICIVIFTAARGKWYQQEPVITQQS